ncbi:hypothetical protein BCR35DRAFT_12304 [Leucosporidium creatinivorum]|uniref:Uncharacterized protein n=1 Tax=Leucosporidium creatinivorum TaxID=106004 RepID=A0A1Y2G8R7_9BASI|nr:hypothetical protein BCR35DRAFT_12304 [Leucosporidium creatinivorum]
MGYRTALYYLDEPNELIPQGPYHPDVHLLPPHSLARFRRVELESSPLHIAIAWWNNHGYRYWLAQRPPASWATESLELQQQHAARYSQIEEHISGWRLSLARFLYPALGIGRSASPLEMAISVRRLQSWTPEEGGSDWQRKHEALMLVELEALSSKAEGAYSARIACKRAPTLLSQMPGDLCSSTSRPLVLRKPRRSAENSLSSIPSHSAHLSTRRSSIQRLTFHPTTSTTAYAVDGGSRASPAPPSRTIEGLTPLEVLEVRSFALAFDLRFFFLKCADAPSTARSL